MALYVTDSNDSPQDRIKLSLNNATEIEIVFLIGDKTFTLKPGQEQHVRAPIRTSIEARPNFIGVASGFLVGGVKKDSQISCSLDKSDSGPESLVLDCAESV